MYQVIKMYGDNEPWWFMEGWQEDIVEATDFKEFEAARTFFEKQVAIYQAKYATSKYKDYYQMAFWDDDDYRYCEECEEDLQQYKGILITYNCQKLLSGDGKEIHETTNNRGKAKCCKRLSKGVRRHAEN